MQNAFIWVAFYSLVQAVGQLLIKLGTNQLGHLAVKNVKELGPVIMQMLKNPLILLGMFLFTSSFFLWIYLLSWFRLGQIFPLTAIVFVFVAWMSFFGLGENMGLVNYFGMALIAGGVYFLLK